MSELLDIVDENDVVIGQAPRDVIHQQQLWHRSTHIALFNSRGEIFIQLRSKTKDIGAGLWDTSAAGHVDSGESYLDCAVRELEEELGIVVDTDQLSPVGRLHPTHRNGFEFTEVFTIQSDQALTLQEEEIDDGVWLTPQALDSRIKEQAAQFTDIFRIIWPMVRSVTL